MNIEDLLKLAGTASGWEILAVAGVMALVANGRGLWVWGAEAKRIQGINDDLRRDVERLTYERDNYRAIAMASTTLVDRAAKRLDEGKR